MALVLEKFLQYERERGDKLFLHQPMGTYSNTWTWKQAGHQARIMAQALHSMGLKKGDNVALLSKNCAEWIIADLAIMMGGFVSVPLYANITGPTIRMILEHSRSKVIIVGKLDNFNEQASGLTPDVPAIYMGLYGNKGSLMWEDMIKKHQPISEVHIPERDELITIMYTSGTTGRPKGVMHTVGNFDDTIMAAQAIKVSPFPKMFSFLPLSHIAERTGIEMLGIFTGATYYFAHSLESFGADLAAVQPDLFFAVPRIWSKFREKVNEKLPEPKLQKLIRIPLLGGLIKKKIRKGMGLNNAKRIFSGAAPISVEMMEWYQKIGVEILQAYGMTEDCVYCHFNLPGANKLGTVGKPLPGLEVRISDEGEIQVKSSALMKGYYREPELTAEMFTADGFLKTGDKGSRDSEGYLTITGRLKDQFKCDKGKYISPTSIEMRLTDSPIIEQACVVGMGIPQPIGLVVLAEAERGKDRIALTAGLIELMTGLNRQLEGHEKLEKIVVLNEPWTVENGLMTPTLKVKRNEVEKIYQGTYSDWFHHHEKIIWE